MSDRSRPVLGALVTCVAFHIGCPAAYATPESGPSLCVVLEQGCEVPGSTVHIKLELGSSDRLVVAGQVVLQYDPDAVDLLEIAAGHACDPASPFGVAIYSAIDEPAGMAVFAVGFSPFVGEHDPQQSSTLACLSFLPKRVSTSDICVLSENEVISTTLVTGLAQRVSIYNAQDCPPDDPESTHSCTQLEVGETCSCDSGSDTCGALDTECRTGICDARAGVCMTAHANEGESCDDGIECTTNDICERGRCVGSDCSHPSLCVVANDCTAPPEVRRVLIRIGAGEPVINAAQFSLRYDPQGLQLLTIAPGRTCRQESPFASEVIRAVDEVNGEISYVVSVSPFGGVGTAGPEVLACATFEIIDRSRSQICLFDGENPWTTRLVDEFGQAVAPYNLLDCPASLPSPITSCSDIAECIVPAVSEWGLVILTLALLVGGKIHFGRR